MARQQINIVWFKRDLRLQDHVPLQLAIAEGLPILMLYIFEPSMLEQPNADLRHARFAWQSLKDMQRVERLNFSISVCYLEAAEVFRQLLRFFEIKTVYSYQEIGLSATQERNQALNNLFDSRNIEWIESPIQGLSESLQDSKVWKEALLLPQNEVNMERLRELALRLSLDKLAAHTAVKGKALPAEFLESMPEGMQSGGEGQALEMLESFFQRRIKGYSKELEHPVQSRHSGSRLSAYLAFGNLSTKQIVQYALQHSSNSPYSKEIKAFLQRLRWRCQQQALFLQHPELEREALWNKNQPILHPDLLEAFKAAETGFPLVDASLRCLQSTGFLNYRLRALLVSFWTQLLEQPWQAIADYLAAQSLDFEPAIHYWQLQLQADVLGLQHPKPIHPVRLAQELDPKAAFILRWIPNLKKLPLHFLQEPWTLRPLEQLFHNLELGKDYPYPIVDIKQAWNTLKERNTAQKMDETGEAAILELRMELLGSKTARLEGGE